MDVPSVTVSVTSAVRAAFLIVALAFVKPQPELVTTIGPILPVVSSKRQCAVAPVPSPVILTSGGPK